MERIQGITNRQFVAMVAIMILISLLTIGVTNYIGNKRLKQTELDSTDFNLLKSFIEKKLIKDKIKKHDSIDKVLVKIDTIYVDRWHKAKTIAVQAPDTCQHYITILVNACDSMKAIKDSINKNLRLKIEEHKAHAFKDSTDIVSLYKEKAKADSTIFSLKNKLEKAVKQKNNWRNAAIIEGGYIILREGKSVLLN
jgi:hypothetical protein